MSLNYVKYVKGAVFITHRVSTAPYTGCACRIHPVYKPNGGADDQLPTPQQREAAETDGPQGLKRVGVVKFLNPSAQAISSAQLVPSLRAL